MSILENKVFTGALTTTLFIVVCIVINVLNQDWAGTEWDHVLSNAPYWGIAGGLCLILYKALTYSASRPSIRIYDARR